MTQIAFRAARSLLGGIDMKKGNTEVTVEPHATIPNAFRTTMYLHGNRIATYNKVTGEVRATLAGWPTPTTRDRINELAQQVGGSGVRQVRHVQYVGGREQPDDEWWVVHPGYDGMDPLLQKLDELTGDNDET